jgi:hypothetical protein
MQFLVRCGSERHVPLQIFSLGLATLDNVDSYKYLGVHFKSTGNPSYYMVAACDRIGAYHVMRSKYCGLFFGANVRLRLSFFNANATSTTLYAGSRGIVILTLEQSERELPKSIVKICAAF